MTLIVVCSCTYVPSQCMLLLLEGIIINYKLVPQHCRYDLRKYYFTISVWNSLPNDVVLADNINAFKKRLE